jgi:hypothetical protein
MICSWAKAGNSGVQGVSFASTINGTSRAKPSNTDCGKRYGCLGKRSVVIAGCDVVASTNRLISKNYHPVT